MATPDKPRAARLRLAGKRIAAVAFSDYSWDPRVRRAAEALVKDGAGVKVICLMAMKDQPRHEILNGVNIIRLPIKRCRGGKLLYLFQYGAFILLACNLLALTWPQFDLVHVHNMPDVLVFSALVPRMFGAKIVLDLHDPMPELMQTIFGLRAASFSVRLLRLLEAWSIRFADAVIATNEASKRLFSRRSGKGEEITVVMNSPDEEIFPFRELSTLNWAGPDSSKPFILMYHGLAVERNGLDLLVKALGKVRASIPGAELKIYGQSTAFLKQVLESEQAIGLSGALRYMGPKNLKQICQAIRECDVCIIPNHRNQFSEVNMPTRIFEGLSQGKIVVAPRTPGILDYFGPAELVLFEPGDPDDLAAKIDYVFRHPKQMIETVKRGQAIYRMHKWTGERLRFVTLMDRLLNPCEASNG